MALAFTESSQSLGPASGGRIKPDIQAPTGSEVAATMEPGCPRTDLVKTHAGTSGATPYAGAAAALIRSWMKADGGSIAPGLVYAGMILAGRHYGSNLNNTEGAGIIELPTDGCAWWGVALAASGDTGAVPLDVSGLGADSLEAALWWPEEPAVDGDGNGVTKHNDVELGLFEPGGSRGAHRDVGPPDPWARLPRSQGVAGGLLGGGGAQAAMILGTAPRRGRPGDRPAAGRRWSAPGSFPWGGEAPRQWVADPRPTSRRS
jgi:hypothetical protein